MTYAFRGLEGEFSRLERTEPSASARATALLWLLGLCENPRPTECQPDPADALLWSGDIPGTSYSFAYLINDTDAELMLVDMG